MKKLLKGITAIFLAACIITTFAIPIFAENSSIAMSNPADEAATTTSLRMQPLVDRYNSLDQADLDKELAKYTDSSSHWGRNYIARISALEIIAGYTDGRFGPNDKLLGGQYILMLIRTMGFRPEVPQGTPYYMPFVNIAIQEGILKKGEITDYTKPISRELSATLARRVIGTYEKVPTDYFVKGSDPYPCKGDKGFFDNVYVGYQKVKMTDYTSITSSRLQDVIDCYRMGLLTGSDNKFNPKGTLTRAEASVIVVKLIDKTMRAESIPTSNESFKWKNSFGNICNYDNEDEGFYENKEYTLYKGLFPLMEIWDTAKAMYKYQNLISGGKIDFTYSEKKHTFAINYFNSEEHFHKYFNDNEYGLILPVNGIGIATHRSQIKKGEEESLYDNGKGWLYEISSYEVDKYNKYLKNYCYELLKVWFGNEYEKAKKIHDQYLGYALNEQAWKDGVYHINGRQIYIYGGHGQGGTNFNMQVWAKGFITKETMQK